MNLPPSHLTVIILMNVCTSIYQKAIEVILMNNDTKKLGAQDSKFTGTIDTNQ